MDLPFPVKTPPFKHRILGLIVAFIGKGAMFLGVSAKAGLFGALGGAILVGLQLSGVFDALVSADLIDPIDWSRESYHSDPDSEVNEPISEPQSFPAGDFIDVFPTALMAMSLLGLVLKPIGEKLLYLGRRLGSLDALEILEKDKRPPVLYLRSFSDDRIGDPTITGPIEWNKRRYEESLHQALDELGPMICIGRPDEKFSESGAVRIYVDDDHWQTAVTHFMKEASAVVFMVGNTKGLIWEIETAVKTVPLNRLLFFFPYAHDVVRTRKFSWKIRTFFFPASALTEEYQSLDRGRQSRFHFFRDRFGALHPAALPQELGHHQFLDFVSEHEARLLIPRRSISSAIFATFVKRLSMHININRTLRPFRSKLIAKSHGNGSQ